MKDLDRTFEEAFSANFPTIHRYLARRVGESLADDLASETFVIALRRWETYSPDRAPVIGWLFGIATNVLRNHRRAELRQLNLMASLRRSSPPADEQDPSANNGDLSPEAAALLMSLNGGQRDALLLRLWADLTDDEIARVLGIRSATVRSRIARAMAKLRGQVRRESQTQMLSEGANGEVIPKWTS